MDKYTNKTIFRVSKNAKLSADCALSLAVYDLLYRSQSARETLERLSEMPAVRKGSSLESPDCSLSFKLETLELKVLVHLGSLCLRPSMFGLPVLSSGHFTGEEVAKTGPDFWPTSSPFLKINQKVSNRADFCLLSPRFHWAPMVGEPPTSALSLDSRQKWRVHKDAQRLFRLSVCLKKRLTESLFADARS